MSTNSCVPVCWGVVVAVISRTDIGALRRLIFHWEPLRRMVLFIRAQVQKTNTPIPLYGQDMGYCQAGENEVFTQTQPDDETRTHGWKGGLTTYLRGRP